MEASQARDTTVAAQVEARALNSDYDERSLPLDEESLAHDYVDGRNARRQGLKLEDCPYTRKRMLNRRRWVEGWLDVDDEVHAAQDDWHAKVRVASHKVAAEVGRVRLAINAARAAGFPLEKLEDLHDELLALYRTK